MMLYDKILNPAQFMRPEADVAGKRNWIKPEFGRKVVAVHVNMWRFSELVAPEIEAVRPGAQNIRHSL
jgi:hypothetical protein